jgi:hypothetical protein
LSFEESFTKYGFLFAESFLVDFMSQFGGFKHGFLLFLGGKASRYDVPWWTGFPI